MKVNGKYVVPPSLTDVFDDHRDDVGSKLRVSAVGSILTYDATKRTASVTLSENLVLANGTVVVVQAPLLDVPVFTMQGGGVHVGFPISPGDECVVVFNDFNIDNWHQNGGQQTPADKSQHDINDGFAIVGPNSLINALVSALSATEGGLATKTAKVAIDKNTQLITIQTGTASLATVLTNLIAAVNATNTPPSANAMSQLVAAVATLTAAIAAMTTATISAGVPQAAAAAVVTTLGTLATTVATEGANASAAATAAAVQQTALLY